MYLLFNNVILIQWVLFFHLLCVIIINTLAIIITVEFRIESKKGGWTWWFNLGEYRTEKWNKTIKQEENINLHNLSADNVIYSDPSNAIHSDLHQWEEEWRDSTVQVFVVHFQLVYGRDNNIGEHGFVLVDWQVCEDREEEVILEL